MSFTPEYLYFLYFIKRLLAVTGGRTEEFGLLNILQLPKWTESIVFLGSTYSASVPVSQKWFLSLNLRQLRCNFSVLELKLS